MAREAVAVAADTDLVLDHADACLALSRVLAAAGDERAAAEAQRDAAALYRAKDAVLMTELSAHVAAPAATPVTSRPAVASRLVLSNSASDILDTGVQAMREGDSNLGLSVYAEHVVYEDHRRLHGDPIADSLEFRTAARRKFEQYPQVDWRPVAVRGERSVLVRACWSDEAGNESTSLDVFEFGDDGLVIYHGRFDEDDFLAAYRELESRYYAGEGAQFAPTARSLDDIFDWMDARGRQVVAQRHWVPVLQWLSPTCTVGRGEISACGVDGEEYRWSFVWVAESRDGLVASIREFDDEDAAFAYAAARNRTIPSRLALTNRVSEIGERIMHAMRCHDLDGTLAHWADGSVYQDRRRISGDPIDDRDGLRTAFQRVFEQYSRFESRPLAVRGERLSLSWNCWADVDGNETITLLVGEMGDDDRIIYQARFDEEDFETAYAELERRYFAGEGAPYAESGAALAQLVLAESRGDLDDAFSMFSSPGLRIESRSRSLFPSRNAAELRRSVEELGTMVASYRVWSPAYCWLSSEWLVARHEREAVGCDGESYSWTRLYVAQVKDGRFTSLCEFDVDDEDAAFAYAEERMRATSNRLAVRNRASELGTEMIRALKEGDVDARGRRRTPTRSCMKPVGTSPVHQSWASQTSATPSKGSADTYSRFELQTVAIRGDRLDVAKHCWSDEAGNQSLGFMLTELNHDGRVIYQCIFDEDDFDSAYRELERRYYAGEGAQFAETGRTTVAFIEALDALDVEAARRVCVADFRLVTPATTLTPDERTLGEFFHWLRERADQVSSVKNFGSVLRWLSPTCFVALGNIRATGADGEQYEWVRIYVAEFRDGLLASMRQFEDEESAFAYTESSLRVPATRLAVSNRASATGSALIADLNAKDIDAAVARYSEQLVYADRRSVGGALVTDFPSVRLGVEVGCTQYSTFEGAPLAVRGDNLVLGWARFSDERGNLTSAFELLELGDDGRIIFNATFDDDDFEGAYRELEKRYYAGEGAEFAEPGLVLAEYITVKNRGDLDTLFDELSTPDVHIDSRSQSVLLDRSAAEYRASLDELSQLVGSPRDWLSGVQWISQRWFVARYEREAVGQDGETYEWSRIVVGEVRHGRLASACQFELADEDAAFGYAEEQVRIAASPLALTNRASELSGSMMRAMQAGEIDIALTHFSNGYVFDDHRRFSGDQIPGRAELRAAIERVLQQFSRFERRVLAVRGERLSLAWSRWSDAAGNETSYLHIYELGDDGLIARDFRFDENDFDAAYRELETRYYAGEGAAFAQHGQFTAEYVIAMNRQRLRHRVQRLELAGSSGGESFPVGLPRSLSRGTTCKFRRALFNGQVTAVVVLQHPLADANA